MEKYGMLDIKIS